MDFQFFGANCFVIEVDKSTFIVDPLPKEYGEKNPKDDKANILLTGFYESLSNKETKFLCNTPGEYEIEGVAIQGIESSSYLTVHDNDTIKPNIIYTLRAKDINVCILGNPQAHLSESTLEQIGSIDVLIVPVGGGGLTMDAEAAADIVKAIEPKICIPSHYQDKNISYPVAQAEVEKFSQTLAVTHKSDTAKLKVRVNTLPENLEVIVIPIA